MTKSLALRIFATARSSLTGAQVLPMSKEDRLFWKLIHQQRKPKHRAQSSSENINEG